MGKQKLYFFAPLGNVDDSILNITLKNGFEINSISFDEGSKIISTIVRIPVADINHWPHYSTVFSQKKIFFISKSFDFDLSTKDKDGNSIAVLDLYFFINKPEKIIRNNLFPVMIRITLFNLPAFNIKNFFHLL